jgi:membrane fusion protein, heavy metal efflux system
MKQYRNLIGVTAFAGVLLLAGCGNAASGNDEHGHGHEAEAADDYARGPHNGRLLEDGDFAVEMTIFETGVPPQFRVYPFQSGKPADPSGVDLTVRLHRLGGNVDEFSFAPRHDYLMGDGVVIEPHSFEIEVVARHGGKTSNWRYDSFEGRTIILDDVAAEAGVSVEDAGPGSIRDVITVSGTVELSPSATAEVRGRYPGPVKSVSAQVGDYVRRGQILAVVESSSSLQEYTVLAPVSGTILERHTNAGDVAGSEALFVIANFANAEAHLHVFPRDVPKVKLGQKVRLGIAGGDLDIETTITRFLPITGAESQTRIAVSALPADAGLQPGMRIVAEVTTAEAQVPLAVRESGLQSFRDFTVVYAKVDETYEVRMLELGRRDGQYAEILSGLEPGETYVTENSYLIKADIEKSGASHDH